MVEDEKPKAAAYMKVDVTQDKEEPVCNIFWSKENILFGQLGEIKATELRIYIKPDAKPFKYPQFWAAPKTLVLEQPGNKHLTTGFLEPTVSEWEYR